VTPAQRLAKNKKPRRTYNSRHGKFDCRIADLRRKLRLTLHDVAGAIGVSDATVYGVENGSDPQLSTAFALSNFFGKTIEELWRPLK
jgi:DNA-binding XRE family transcriptional regulator